MVKNAIAERQIELGPRGIVLDKCEFLAFSTVRLLGNRQGLLRHIDAGESLNAQALQEELRGHARAATKIQNRPHANA